jgi:hypothetical protein
VLTLRRFPRDFSRVRGYASDRPFILLWLPHRTSSYPSMPLHSNRKTAPSQATTRPEPGARLSPHNQDGAPNQSPLGNPVPLENEDCLSPTSSIANVVPLRNDDWDSLNEGVGFSERRWELFGAR